MIYLSGAIHPPLIEALPTAGYMLTPNMGNRPDLTGIPWGADTGCYSAGGSREFNLERYLAWLRGMDRYRESCLFATAPDVVRDARATWERSRAVLPLIRSLGYPAALVVQDGIEELAPLPWDEWDVLFIGGSDEFKAAAALTGLISEAKGRGQWVHMGRVNTWRRLRASQSLGCDSADGTYLAFGPDTNLPKLTAWMRSIELQPPLSLW